MKALLTALFAITLSLASASVQSNSAVRYLDESGHFAWFMGNGVATVFWDLPGDLDLFTHHIDALGNPVLMTMEGQTIAYCYFLDFIGTSGNYLVFDMYGDQGVGWVYFGTFFL
jgi:hypothetical protein